MPNHAMVTQCLNIAGNVFGIPGSKFINVFQVRSNTDIPSSSQSFLYNWHISKKVN